jgi:hypothetical protein
LAGEGTSFHQRSSNGPFGLLPSLYRFVKNAIKILVSGQPPLPRSANRIVVSVTLDRTFTGLEFGWRAGNFSARWKFYADLDRMARRFFDELIFTV